LGILAATLRRSLARFVFFIFLPAVYLLRKSWTLEHLVGVTPVGSRTLRAGELRSAPSGPDDWIGLPREQLSPTGVRGRRAITRVSEG